MCIREREREREKVGGGWGGGGGLEGGLELVEIVWYYWGGGTQNRDRDAAWGHNVQKQRRVNGYRNINCV